MKIESNVVALIELQVEDYIAGTRRAEAISDVEPFSIESGESFEVGRQRAIQNLAEKLVIALEDWGPPPPPAP